MGKLTEPKHTERVMRNTSASSVAASVTGGGTGGAVDDLQGVAELASRDDGFSQPLLEVLAELGRTFQVTQNLGGEAHTRVGRQ